MAAAIRIDDLTAGYARHPAVHHLSGSFACPGLHAIVGPNGAGKSTLLKAMMGLLRPDGGRIDLGSVDPRAIAYLPQRADIDHSFPISVLDTVLLGHWRRTGAFGGVDLAGRRAAETALAEVGMDGFGRRPIGSLSVGQLQRVLFARIVLQDAPIILLDEPFAGIDAPTITDLLALIERWRVERRTVVAVLHDLALVREHFAHTLLLARTAIAWGPTPEVLTRDNLMRAWGMPQAWDEHAVACRIGLPA